MKSLEINAYQWSKLGLVYSAVENNPSWGPSHALVPNPTVLNDTEVRIHCSFLDEDFKGQIGFVDLKISNQVEVIKISHEPITTVARTSFILLFFSKSKQIFRLILQHF